MLITSVAMQWQSVKRFCELFRGRSETRRQRGRTVSVPGLVAEILGDDKIADDVQKGDWVVSAS